MLRALWRWLVGADTRKDELLATLKILMEQQQQSTQAVMGTVQTFAQVAEKQAEVLNSYIQLFKQPGETQRWQADPVEENNEELKKLGFPFEASEAEQAAWMLNHIDQL